MLLRIVRREQMRSFFRRLPLLQSPLLSSFVVFEMSNGMVSFLYAAVNRTKQTN